MAQTAILGSALCWIYSRGHFEIAFESLEFIGRMTLTNYLLQNVLALWLFSGAGLGLLHRTSYAFCVEVAAVVYLVQIFFSHWWLSYFRLGPVEWAWRSLSYGRRLPNQRARPIPSETRKVLTSWSP